MLFRSPYGISETYTAYVSGLEAKDIKGLHSLENGGNVFLYEPQDEGVFQFRQSVKGVEVVSDVQLYLDLDRKSVV